jgi:hypothetical protein
MKTTPPPRRLMNDGRSFPNLDDGHLTMTEPPPPSEELIGLLSAYDLKVGELALRLREMVLTEAPDAAEKFYSGYVLALWYSFSGKFGDAFCHIAVYRGHVNLGFNRGAELDDPRALLLGEGRIIRHLKVEQAADLKRPHLRKFIRAAIKHAKSRQRAKLLERASGSSVTRGNTAARRGSPR